jgi:hypothetical protein
VAPFTGSTSRSLLSSVTLIQFRIASRRNKVNTTPCTSLGKRTGGGFNPVDAEISHGLAMAGSVNAVPQTAMFLGI